MPETAPDPAPDPLADRLALVELVARLNRWFDDPATGDARSFYTADAEVVLPRARRREAGDRPSGDDGERTQHLTSDVVVDLAGDRAAIGANALACAFRPGRPLHRMTGLRYDLTAVRTPVGWRLTRVAITRQWSHHPRPAEL